VAVEERLDEPADALWRRLPAPGAAEPVVEKALEERPDRVSELNTAPESYGFDDTAEVAVELGAGSVLFFNGYLLHRSKPNRSDGYRRTFVGHYLNAWSLLPWRQRQRPEDPNVAELDSRRVVPVAGHDPYEWKGYETDPGAV